MRSALDFGNVRRSSVGFDRLFEMMENDNFAGENYPPFDLIKEDENRFRIEIAVASDHAVRGHREDLDEMLGNLLDNACRWARSRVAVSSSNGAGGVVIAIDDDGPGLDAALREAVLQRGVRADEAEPGSGFGLAIVRELAEVYGGSVALDQSPLGGLRARLRLPAASAEQ